MQITRNSLDSQKGPADWFTGDVYIDAAASPSEPDAAVELSLGS
jgi:hypothetical protein